MEIRRSEFTSISFAKHKPKRGYPVQDSIINLANSAGISKGLVFKLWNLYGNDFIFETESKYKQGEIKNLKAFLLYKLKKDGFSQMEN